MTLTLRTEVTSTKEQLFAAYPISAAGILTRRAMGTRRPHLCFNYWQCNQIPAVRCIVTQKGSAWLIFPVRFWSSAVFLSGRWWNAATLSRCIGALSFRRLPSRTAKVLFTADKMDYAHGRVYKTATPCGEREEEKKNNNNHLQSYQQWHFLYFAVWGRQHFTVTHSASANYSNITNWAFKLEL